MPSESEKIRIRSKEELQSQLAGLIQICEVLESCGLRWFLSGGTLLGAVRGGHFIPWDWDVEVTVLTEQARPLRSHMLEKLSNLGFGVSIVDHSITNFKIVVTGFGTKYEIVGLRRKGGRFRSRGMMDVSASLFEVQEFVRLGGQSFPAPSPAISYLEEVYGDWQIPKRTSVKSEYLTPQANKKQSFFSHIMRRVSSTLP